MTKPGVGAASGLDFGRQCLHMMGQVDLYIDDGESPAAELTDVSISYPGLDGV